MFTLPDDQNLDADAFADMVESAWKALVASPISRDNSLRSDAPIDKPLCAVISISLGDARNATLAITAGSALARHFADQLFQLDTDLDTTDIDDAFGELVNVVGGHVKGLIDEVGARLSLPAVTRDAGHDTDGVAAISCGFRVDGMPMFWELFDSETSPLPQQRENSASAVSS